MASLVSARCQLSDADSPIPAFATQAAPPKAVPTPATTAAPAAALAASPAITPPATSSLLSPLGAGPAVASTAGFGGFGSAFGAAKPAATLASPGSGAAPPTPLHADAHLATVKPALRRELFRAAALRTTHGPCTGSLFGASTSAFAAAPVTSAFGATAAFGAAATPAFGAAPAATTPNSGTARPMAYRCVPVDVDATIWEAFAQRLPRRLVQVALAALGQLRPLALPPRAK